MKNENNKSKEDTDCVIKSCNRTLSFDSGIGISHYKCDKNAFMNVIYISPFNSEIVDESLCKRHYNAFIKNTNRITKKTKFDFKLEFKKII